MADSPLAPWRDAAVVLLAAQVFVLGLLPLVAVYYATRGMRWLLNWLRGALSVVNKKTQLVAGLASAACGRIVAPFVAVHGWMAGAQATLHALASRFGHSSALRARSTGLADGTGGKRP